jgi:hypothetical protein
MPLNTSEVLRDALGVGLDPRLALGELFGR